MGGQTLKGAAIFTGVMLALPAMAQQVRVAEQSFTQIDQDGDGTLTLTEFRQAVVETDNPAAVYGEVDSNQDDVVTQAEWSAWREEQTAAGEDQEMMDRLSYAELGLTAESLYGEAGTDAGIIGLDGNVLAGRLLATTDRDLIASGQLMAPGLLDSLLPDFFSIALGGKLQFGLLSDPSDDIISLMPGLEARLNIPLFGLETAATGEIFYAPDALTFGESTETLDFSANYEVRFLPNTVGFVGFHLLRFEREDGNKSIIDDVQGGLRFEF